MDVPTQSFHLEDELSCSICLELFSRPVELPCGHNFCAVCLDRSLAVQRSPYRCPDCGWESTEKPVGRSNFKLKSIVERYGISFTQPAEGPRRNCTEHEDPLKFYCEDCKSCICTVCAVAGIHNGHSMVLFSKADAQVQCKLAENLEIINSKVETCNSYLQQFQEDEGDVRKYFEAVRQKKRDCLDKLQKLLEDFKEQIEACVIAEEEVTLRKINAKLRNYGRRKEELTAIQESIKSNMAEKDHFLSIQNFLSLEERIAGTIQEDPPILPGTPIKGKTPVQLCDKHFEHFKAETEKLHQILQNLKLKWQGCPYLTFDPNTTSPKLLLSDNNKTVEGTKQNNSYSDHPMRFEYHPQVLCMQSFSSGCNAWEVEVLEGGNWAIGVATKKMPSKGWDNCSLLGYNADSWCLYNVFGKLAVWHNNQRKMPIQICPVHRIRVLLDLDAGVLSFYHASTTLELLYTFNEKFTVSLFPCFWLGAGTKLALRQVTNI
ncbi:E3 ubiquitin-protein ligase TRIM39-like [Polypterus senegalus]|uniref:E3 ubiquitin-protein ligase TRIM39-like n=1 Tax=Polypterus senegalus TaxID=55291 RepID=UPI0019631433|nr:E3 ubiquitin-protein ligase TRIM39-like [Polypterus senegalus]